MPLTQMCTSVSSTCAFGTHGCSTANDANSDNLVAALYILRAAAGLEPWPEHSPMVFEFCSGLVDLVVRVRHCLGGGHRFALAGERFVGRLAEHIALVISGVHAAAGSADTPAESHNTHAPTSHTGGIRPRHPRPEAWRSALPVGRIAAAIRAASTRRTPSKVRSPVLRPRRLGSTAAVCSTSTRVTRPPIRSSGRKLAARAVVRAATGRCEISAG